MAELSNAEVAQRLEEIADLLDLLDERFKPAAYRRAARSIEALPEGLAAILARDGARSIPGVGEAIGAKVETLVQTGTLPYLDRLRAQIPAGVLALMRLPGVGPKTARRFWVELGIEGPGALATAIAAGRLEGVRGFGERKIAQLAAAVAAPAGGGDRRPIEVAWSDAATIVAALRAVPSVREVAVAGSLRRGRETVGDLDVLATAEAPEAAFDAFSALPSIGEVRLRGPTKETVRLRNGLQVDLRVVEPEAFGAALAYFTGSKDHNVRLRTLARERGLKVNEYGVYRGEERIAGRTEEEVYASLGLAWIPPELREDRGEIAAAEAHTLPRLVAREDLRFEPHRHLDDPTDPAELDRLVTTAAARGVQAVGVVVATLGGAGPPLRVRADTWKGRTERASVRLVPLAELRGPVDAGSIAEVDALGWGRLPLVLVPSVGSVPAPEAFPGRSVLLVAHAGGPAERLPPILGLARGVGAAVEVGPGADRLDSNGGRLALEDGLALSVPLALDEPPDGPTAGVALAFARRAGAVRERLLNATGPSPPAGIRPKSPDRPKPPRGRPKR